MSADLRDTTGGGETASDRQQSKHRQLEEDPLSTGITP